MNWRTVDGENIAPLSEPQYEVLLNGMFQKERLLDIIQNFILFQESKEAEKDIDRKKIGDKKSIIKILAAYHQYFAVKKAIEKKKKRQGKTAIGRSGLFGIPKVLVRVSLWCSIQVDLLEN